MKTMVLILDDEAHIRSDLLKHIKKAGFEVCAASTQKEAIKIIQDEHINFAIIDLKIDYQSEYGGIKVIEAVNQIRPNTKIIVLSAYELTREIENELNKVYYDCYVPKGGEQNYIESVIDTLSRLKEAPPKKICFVIMPFSDTNTCSKKQWTEVFETMIKPAIDESDFHYECFRASLDIGNIIKDILINLNRADIVIADLTDRNPNVFYELGVRHALKNATILITQDIKHVPFDLQHYALVEYDWITREGRDKFKTRIYRILNNIEDDPNDPNLISPVREYLQT